MSELSYAIEMITAELHDQPHGMFPDDSRCAGYVAGLEWALERLEAAK
jgi:hypothetical protein